MTHKLTGNCKPTCQCKYVQRNKARQGKHVPNWMLMKAVDNAQQRTKRNPRQREQERTFALDSERVTISKWNMIAIDLWLSNPGHGFLSFLGIDYITRLCQGG